jgi:hypothetical protein
MVASVSVALAPILLSADAIDQAEKCFCAVISKGRFQSRVGAFAGPRNGIGGDEALQSIAFDVLKPTQIRTRSARWPAESPTSEAGKV